MLRGNPCVYSGIDIVGSVALCSGMLSEVIEGEYDESSIFLRLRLLMLKEDPILFLKPDTGLYV